MARWRRDRANRRIFASALLGLAVGAGASFAATEAEELILCGGKEVFVLDLKADGKKVWSWLAAEHSEIPATVRKQFGTTDDCKPVQEGSKLLITSSGGGVALVERASGRALFWASVEDAHSAELLPRDRVVVAGADGNRLALFDLSQPEKEIASHPLEGAHGLVWDPELRYLWALGYKELQAYELKDWGTATPAFALSRRFDLPDRGGHDLRPLPGTRRLALTTDQHVWTFDPESRRFEPFDGLGDLQAVKSVDIDPRTGRIAYVQAETSWWSSRVFLLGAEGEVQRRGERLYKARWNCTIQGIRGDEALRRVGGSTRSQE
ncbi:MAG: DUF6528 family protein [Verrucomicrobiota bacterium]